MKQLHTLEEYRVRLVQWRRAHPAYAAQLFKMQKTLDKMSQQCAFLIRQYELSNKQKFLDQADKIVSEATDTMNKLKNYELIATLSGK